MAEITKQDPLFKYTNLTANPLTNEVEGYEQQIADLYAGMKDQASNKIAQENSGLYSNYISTQQSSNAFGAIQDNRIKTKDFSIDQQDVYKPVGDELIAIYPDYIQGTDNNERLANSQSTWDKWSNGVLKAGANLLTTIAGSTVGFVVGATNGVTQGSWNAVFDNSFSNVLANWNDKLNYQLPNYVSKDEQNDNFLQSAGTANFWAKDVLGGLSFTLGTIASEAIWAFATGGIANSAKWGLEGAQLANKLRWGKIALGIEETAVGVANYKKFIADGVNLVWKNASLETQTANIFAKTAKTLNTARFLATSSGNEAGIEALQFKREQTENFYRDFEKLNGRNPSQEEIEKFNNNLEQSANVIFATNMAILAPSNIAMFGSLFNINSPVKGLSKAMNKSLFGIGVEKVAGEAGEIAYKGLEATGKQKIAQYTYAALKPILTEGLWEEGLQGVTTKASENWIKTTYDPKYNNKTVSLADGTYKAFADQYGTKEGWKEIGIGGIIGFGSSIVIGGGNFEEIHEFKEAQKYQDKYVSQGLNQFGDQSTLATDSVARKFAFDARVQNAVERQKQAIDKGDDVEASLSQQDQLLAEFQFRKSMGESLQDLVNKYETAVNAIPNNAPDFIESGITDPQGYKEAIIESYKGLVNSYEKASDFADAVLGDSKILGQDIQTQSLKDALTYSIVSGQKASTAMNGLLQDMGKIIGNESVKSLQIQTELQKLGRDKIKQVLDVNQSIAQSEQQVKALSKELQRLQVSKDEEKGTRLQSVQEKLTDANERVVSLKAEREELAKQVSQESKRRSGVQGEILTDVNLTAEFVTGEDLAGIDEKLQNIENSIKSYEGVNHEIYYDLLDLKRQYNSAKENFFSFQSSVNAIVNGKFKANFSKANGLLGRIINSKAPIDNYTGQYLSQIWENYTNSAGREAVDTLTEDIVSDEDYRAFQQENLVPDEILNSIAEKVKKSEVLTARENEIFQSKASEINALLKPNPNKPDLNRNIIVEEPLSEAEKLRKIIEDSFAKDYPMLTQDVDELIKGKPSKNEVDRYQELYKKQVNLTKKEVDEYSELQPRMQRWFMAQSLPVRSATIADLIELLSQVETQLDRDETLNEINSDVLAQETAEQKNASSTIRQDILQNISGNAVVKIKDNDIYFIHINPKTIIDRLVQGAGTYIVQTVNKKGLLNKSQDLTPAILESEIKKTGTVFTIGSTKITIGERGSTVMSLEDYNKVKDTLNMYYFDSNSGKWSYADIYERLEDGTTRKVSSEFNTNTISDYIYDVEAGDNLNLFVDMKTEYNQDLIYRALDELDKTGEISTELKETIFKTLEITSRDGLKNNSTLKALYDNVSDDNFAYLRKKYADRFIEILEAEQALATLPNKIDLEVDLSVKEIFLGTPNYQLDDTLKPLELPITERGIEQVITQGYVKGTEMFLGNKAVDTENISRLYVTNLARVNPELKIPVVVLQKGVHQFAFPVTMVKTLDNKESQLDAILTAVEVPTEVSKAVNNLMISLGLNTRITVPTEENITNIRAELQNYTTFKTADDLADANYKKEFLIQDATSKIDLEDALISSPKITIDYSTLTIGKLEETENTAISLRQDIVKDLKEIEKIVNRTVEIPDQNRIMEAFDNNAVENKGIDILNRKDINFIKDYFFTTDGKLKSVQGVAVETIGKEKLLRLRDKLQTLQFYEKQITVKKDKNTESKLKCK